MEMVMEFNPGDVVMLKSGGETVVEIADTGIECVWIGEEGGFFREVLPPVAWLEEIGDEEEDDEEEEDEDEDDDDDDEEDEEDEEEEEKPATASKRKSN